MSDSGKADGELSRIHSYGEVHPNVIRVGEPHWSSGFIAVTADPSIQLDGWESLKKTDYRVNYRRGIKGCEANLPGVVRPERLGKVDKVSVRILRTRFRKQKATIRRKPVQSDSSLCK